MKIQNLTQEDIMKMLDSCYSTCLEGIPQVSPSVKKMAEEYLNRYKSAEAACQAMLNNQVIKCTTSGFIAGFGGVLAMPVTIPANITSVLYVQMRMIACAAYMAGYNLDSDATQTLVYACLAGVSLNSFIKRFGVELGKKLTMSMIKKIPGKALTKINQKVGFRLLTKFGSKGLVNLGKMVPGVGGIIGGGMDLVETRIIADRAYNWYFLSDFNDQKNKKK